jgi:hypothetical protein
MIWVAGRSPTLVSQNLKATTLTYLAIASQPPTYGLVDSSPFSLETKGKQNFGVTYQKLCRGSLTAPLRSAGGASHVRLWTTSESPNLREGQNSQSRWGKQGWRQIPSHYLTAPSRRKCIDPLPDLLACGQPMRMCNSLGIAVCLPPGLTLIELNNSHAHITENS